MAQKPQVLEKRHDKECSLCYSLDTEKNKEKPTKFHCFEDRWFNNLEKNICDNCLKEIKEIRKRCHQVVDNPKKMSDLFADYLPWFVKEIPGLETSMKANRKKQAEENKK